MMRKLLRAGIVIAILATLAGCLGHGRGRYNQQNYWKHAQVITPVSVPSDIRVKPALGFYPAPHVDVSGDNSPPSLIPPGSKIEYYRDLKRSNKRGRV